MTNEELLQDLKQFITATARAELTSATEDLRAGLSGDIKQVQGEVVRLRDDLTCEISDLRTEMRTGFAAAAKATGEIHEQLEEHDRRLIDHGRRIQHLEHNAA